ncbi:hypothetical protein EWM64_g5527 [Hericium alpestre]|uniref:G-protein coupled receptors family 1 profile domain-containing protein n=1 Tax=Hericium alpestre TaxID=135208 RepID=A0A4Y9ZWC2_9AGAM|nr:hypothetical protein EWM64_g5527 [Hericium alpestre]
MCGETQYKIVLSAVWVEALLYGLYMVFFSASIYILVWHRPNKRNLIISVALFVFTTADVFLDYSLTMVTPNTLSASYVEGGALVPCPDADLTAWTGERNIYDLLSLLIDVMYTINFVLADGLLISRCVTIWSTTRSIVIPLGLLLVGTTACNLASIYYDSVLYIAGKSPHASQSTVLRIAAINNRFLEVGDILSLATNVITTSLIVFKIWRMTREIERAMGRRAGVRYRAAMAMLIESGALFSASLVTSLASAYASVNFDIAEVFVAMLMGIAPTLIIVRVGLGKGFETVQDSMRESFTGHASAPGRELEVSRIRFQAMQSTASDDARGRTKSSKPSVKRDPWR